MNLRGHWQSLGGSCTFLQMNSASRARAGAGAKSMKHAAAAGRFLVGDPGGGEANAQKARAGVHDRRRRYHVVAIFFICLLELWYACNIKSLH